MVLVLVVLVKVVIASSENNLRPHTQVEETVVKSVEAVTVLPLCPSVQLPTSTQTTAIPNLALVAIMDKVQIPWPIHLRHGTNLKKDRPLVP